MFMRPQRFVLAIIPFLLTSLVVAVDTDGDGIGDELDVCCNTPFDTPVDTQGRPFGDFDLDCDVDLEDYRVFAGSYTGLLEPCPVNECLLGTQECDTNATCTDLTDGYSCTCNTGFEGDGFICTDIDECAGINPCGDFGVCMNQAGNYWCDCDTGFQNIDGTCVDIGECSKTPDICGPNAICTNETGSYACSCESGFSDCTPSAGCETDHGDWANVCSSASNLGSFCGDEQSGFLCPTNDWINRATRTGRTSKWFRSRASECSDCCADVSQRIVLIPPSGTDYDLFVYSSCGILISSSQNGTGQLDEVIMTKEDGCFGADASFDLWIEVRYYLGASCNPWQLNVYGH